MAGNGGAMKVTTVRFGSDLWRLLEAEAALAGVSVSQYIREAALARAATAAAVRGADPLALLAGAVEQPDPADSSAGQGTTETIALGAAVRRRAAETRAELHATRAQAGQAIRRSHQLAEQSETLRRRPAP